MKKLEIIVFSDLIHDNNVITALQRLKTMRDKNDGRATLISDLLQVFQQLIFGCNVQRGGALILQTIKPKVDKMN